MVLWYYLFFSVQKFQILCSLKKRSLVKAKKEEADATTAPIIIVRNETMEVTFIFCVFEYFVKWIEHYNGMPPSLHYHQPTVLNYLNRKIPF